MSATADVTWTLMLLLAVATVTAAPPRGDEQPSNPAECVKAGGECIPTKECPNWEHGWRQPFKGICQKEGYECCFKDITQHTMRCGVFGGDCAPAASCGRAPQHRRARCDTPGDVCCIWLI